MNAPLIQTVLGPIRPAEFGFVLPHEHVLCDFIGAEKTGPHRWNADEVFRTMVPYLRQAKERGVAGFVDCTPAYIGRDVRLLQRLARETGLHLLTNTGYYGAANDKYLPAHAHTETADALAARWIREWERGIDGTDVRPGFIKIGVDPCPLDKASGEPPKLSDVDAKIVRAAARAAKRTGLTVASHTVQGAAALAELAIFAEEGVSATKFIYVHADGEKDLSFHRQVAAKGGWVEFDAVGSRPADEHLKLILPLIEAYPDRVLLSMDRGWYNAGEPNGGKIRDYNALPDTFLPAMRAAGVSEATIRKLTVENPAKAFAVGG
jgi:predicted metal-dependent phosphotriesterase family hydrolase